MSRQSRDTLICATAVREAQSQTLLTNLKIKHQWVLIFFLMMPCNQNNTATELELIFLQKNQIGLC